MNTQIINGDALEVLRTLPDESVHCCVTSPPYWGLRSYLPEGHPDKPLEQGLEETPEAYVARMVEVFREVRRVLRDDGTLWLNLGDCYASAPKGNKTPSYGSCLDGRNMSGVDTSGKKDKAAASGLAHKQLVGIPWRVAFALQADGWWLRQDIIWAKPNPMPESVRDRCTKAHEYVFLLTKSERYFYDADAIREPWEGEAARAVALGSKAVGQRGISKSARRGLVNGQATQFSKQGHSGYFGADGKCLLNPLGANKRSVWKISTKPYRGAHFATMPPDLAETCIKAGCPAGGTVLDPFAGSGTTLAVAQTLGRSGIGIELNPEYIPLAEERVATPTRAPKVRTRKPAKSQMLLFPS